MIDIVILAAGFGTRLKKISSLPKGLLEINGQTLMDILYEKIRNIRSVQINKIHLITNSLFYEPYSSWAAKTGDGRIEVFDNGVLNETGKLGSNKDIYNFLLKCGSLRDFILLASDNYFDVGLEDILRQITNTNFSICGFRLSKKEELSRYGVLIVDSEDKVNAVEEKKTDPASDIINAGIVYITKELIPYIHAYHVEGREPDEYGRLLDYLCRKIPAHFVEIKGKWFDVGTPESYELLKTTVRSENECARPSWHKQAGQSSLNKD